VFSLAFPASAPRKCATFTAGFGGYSGLNAEVIGVSVGGGGQPVRAGGLGAKEKIGVTLASDFNKGTTGATTGVSHAGRSGDTAGARGVRD